MEINERPLSTTNEGTKEYSIMSRMQMNKAENQISKHKEKVHKSPEKAVLIGNREQMKKPI